MTSTCACDTPDDDTAGLTPRPLSNPAGRAALDYRIGTHGSFYATMKSRLSSYLVDPDGAPPLAGLTTRDADDPAIALLDAWATVADVLTFYQERIANEGYLRTAVEDQSVQALAAMVGYRPRPGLAASVFLAYVVDDPGNGGAVVIPAGSQVQSVPAAGGLPQTFETSDRLVCQPAWSRLRPRQTRGQQPAPDSSELYVAGTATGLQPNDPLVLVAGGNPLGGPLRVARIEPDFAANRTRVLLQRPLSPRRLAAAGGSSSAGSGADGAAVAVPASPLTNEAMLTDLARTGTSPSPLRPSRAAAVAPIGADSELAARVATALMPALGPLLPTALARAATGDPALPPVEVYRFRIRAAPFGHNAPLQAVLAADGRTATLQEWTLRKSVPGGEPEPFRIEAEIAPARERGDGSFAVKVSIGIGGHPMQGGDNSQTPGEITIVDREAGEETVVTIGRDLRFNLRRRNISLMLTPGADGNFSAGASGCETVRLDLSSGDNRDRPSRKMRLAGRTRGGPGGSVATEDSDKVFLDTVRAGVVPGGWVMVERADDIPPVIAQVQSAVDGARADYGLSGASTRVGLDVPWLGRDRSNNDLGEESFASVIRGGVVHAGSEALALARAPETADVEGTSIELDGVCTGLDGGRWLIVEGERTDVDGTEGVHGAEVVRLAGATHPAPSGASADEPLRTVLLLTAPLLHAYRRSTVVIHGNVAHATHGESQQELLGSGDGTRAALSFQLKQGPLTYVPSIDASGAASTLEVRVNDIRWHEAESFAGLGPQDRGYLSRLEADGSRSIVFGDGRRGARPPTGIDNIRATYRRGLGSLGNVSPGQLSMLASRPLGVSGVTNPLGASGGADPETAASARRNAPLALPAGARCVSVADHADFARVHAGVGKADAARLSTKARQIVCVTIAGTDETPLEPSSDLCLDLLRAMRRCGDGERALRVLPAELLLLVVDARVRLLADYLWASVEAALRAALLARFGYDARELGQDAVLSQLIATMQQVPGVDGVDVDVFDRIAAASRAADIDRLAQPAAARCLPSQRVRAAKARDGANGLPLPAQLAFVSARVPGLIRLSEAAP